MKWFTPKRRFETEMDEELRGHFERKIEANIAAGMLPEEARRAALRQFGRIESIKEICRDERPFVWLEQLLQDMRVAARTLWKSPSFALAAVLTLALGTGATTAVFTVANDLLLKPLAFPHSNRVMSLWEGKEGDVSSQTPMAPTQFVDLRPQLKSFKALAGWAPAGINFVPKDGTPERFQGSVVTEDFFNVVETHPVIGSGFTPENFKAGQDGVVIIGQGIWRDRFGSSPGVIGQIVRINGRERTIVGVMPPGFQSPAKSQFWAPKLFNEHEMMDRNYKTLLVLGRLKDGVTEAQARAELATGYAALRREYPDFLDGWETRLHPALEDAAKPARPALYVLVAAVVAMLIMACVNVANLTLARGARRMGELSVRAALGASRGKLMRQLLVENLVLSTVGVALGALFGKALLTLLLSAAPQTLPRIDQVKMDWLTLGAAIAVCVGSGVLFGLVPACRLSQRDPARELKDCGQRSTAGVGWLRKGLAAFQVAASVVVLIGAALLLRSFDRLMREDLGFKPENLMTARIELPPAKYSVNGRRELFADEVLRELRSSVGIQDAAATTYLPLQAWPHFIMRTELDPNVEVSKAPAVGFQGVSDDYLRTMGMRIDMGRDFSKSDGPEAPLVCLVNQAFVRRHIPGGQALGKRVEVGFSEPPNWMEIVGIVHDARNQALDSEPEEQVIVPLAQEADFFRGNPALSLIVRADAGFNAGDAIRRAVWRFDKDQPLHQLRPMLDLLVDARSQRRFTALVLSMFAAAAAALAAIGLFGVMSGDVTARTREFGLRMALGALPKSVTRLALRAGMFTLAIGLAAGIFGAWAGARLIRTMLYHTEVMDPAAWTTVFFVLTVSGVAACYWPARRAGKVDPIVALRNE